MQMKSLSAALLRAAFLLAGFVLLAGCQKSAKEDLPAAMAKEESAGTPASPPFQLEVILRGEDKAFGLVKFRQNNDAAKIVTLEVWVRDLQPDHQYLLQRAVDTNLDGECTSTAWLTLGKGLQAQAITTGDKGTGREELWRDLSALATGAAFDIHFRVVDAVSKDVVLTSDCYRYVVR
jgi:hypothetical protein